MKITSIEKTDSFPTIMESLSVDAVCEAIKDGTLEDYLNGVKLLINDYVQELKE